VPARSGFDKPERVWGRQRKLALALSESKGAA
jgi:hypothetical protein